MFQNISGSNDKEVDSNALKIEVGTNADGVMIHGDSVMENAANNGPFLFQMFKFQTKITLFY